MAYEDYNAETAERLIEQHGAKPQLLVQILHSFSEHFGWICEDAIGQLAATLNLSRADVHGVVSYYDDFRTQPPGRHVIRICQAEACQAMGSASLTNHAQAALGAKLHETVGNLTLEAVYCLGNCACSPAIMVNGNTYGRVNTDRFDRIIEQLQSDEA